MAGSLGNLLSLPDLRAALGFGNWESTVTSITGPCGQENVVATVALVDHEPRRGNRRDRPVASGPSFAATMPRAAARRPSWLFCAFTSSVRAIASRPSAHTSPQGSKQAAMTSAKWDSRAAIGHYVRLRLVRGPHDLTSSAALSPARPPRPFTRRWLARGGRGHRQALLFRPAAKAQGRGQA
ncbi:MAG: hypothetical protein ACLTDR_04885 [Adlercreutzia equolifaciens]